MNYPAWRAHRDHLLESHDPLRLDCMNPFRALDHLYLGPEHEEGAAPDVESVAGAWSRCTGVELSGREWIVTRGVRSLLELWCRSSRAQTAHLFLPEDVFPIYWALAGGAGISSTAFPTLPRLDLTSLDAASRGDCVVLPTPLSPLGCELEAEQIEHLVAWLGESEHRTLILDLVYAYGGAEHRGLERLRATGQCIEAWSISKTWIQRQVFGVAIMSRRWRDELQLAHGPEIQNVPDRRQLTLALACFERQSQLPRMLQERFRAQWSSLGPRIRKACPEWSAPACGYFSMLPIPAARLLGHHGILAVPASVFGSRSDELSIITCLHDIKRDDGVGPTPGAAACKRA